MSWREESASPADGKSMGSTEEQEGPEDRLEKMNQETEKMDQETTEKMDLERAEMEDSLWPLRYLDEVDKIDSMDQLSALENAIKELLTRTKQKRRKKQKELVHKQQKPDSSPNKKQKTGSLNIHMSHQRDPRCSTSTAAPHVAQSVPFPSNPLYTRNLLEQLDAQSGAHATVDQSGVHATEDQSGAHATEDQSGAHATEDQSGAHVTEDKNMAQALVLPDPDLNLVLAQSEETGA